MSPIARTMIAALWLMRLAKLKMDRNVEPSKTPKSTMRAIRPSTAGSEPISPPRTRAQ